MTRGRITILLLLFLMVTSTQYWYLNFLGFGNNLNIQELEENNVIDRKVPRLASDHTYQIGMEGKFQTKKDEIRTAVDSTLTGFFGGFLENKGQKNAVVYYYTESSQISVGFSKSKIIFNIIESNAVDSIDDDPLKVQATDKSTSYNTITVEFLGSNDVIPIAQEPTGIFSNFFIGSDETKWAINSQYYTKIVYYNIYEKIDLVYVLKDGQLKYEFYVHPGGKIDDIRLNWIGPVSLDLTDEGMRVIVSPIGNSDEFSFVDSSPINYQSEKRKKPISGSFVMLDQSAYGFSIPSYDPQQLLIIDPILSYSTYVSGSDNDDAGGIAFDSFGNAYVTGYTTSADFPIVNPYDVTANGGIDVFVFKLNSTGNGLLYSTYVGGFDGDEGIDIAVDGAGNAYVTGKTYSNDFPTANAYDALGDNNTLVYDVFVFKLNSTGNGLLYSTYVGGSEDDLGTQIAIDGAGNAHVTGYTKSTNFPMVNPYDPLGDNNTAYYDVFVFKLAANGSTLLFSTFVSGGLDDYGMGIAIDGAGNTYVAGATMSTDFITVNAYDATGDGNMTTTDIFVFKLNSAGNNLLYSTYVGGSSNDGYMEIGIAVDGAGNAYVTSGTVSTDFPTVNAYDALGDNTTSFMDVFVFKLNSTGNGLDYSTYVSGSNDDVAYGIAVDSFGNAYVTGYTFSTDFPTIDAYDATGDANTTTSDAFVFKLNSNGNGLDYSTYMSGFHYDVGLGITIDSSGCVYITGKTYSNDFPTVNAYDVIGDNNTSKYDVFVAKLEFYSAAVSIDDDSDFAVLGFPGAGTQGNPYIIKGLNIVNSTVNSIQVQNTSAYFIICDNYLDGITGNNQGIYLYNVTNGLIINNTICNFKDGISVYYTSSSTILNNTIYNNSDYGILVLSSIFATIENNTLYNNIQVGIWLRSANNNTVHNNTIFNSATIGIFLNSSATYNNLSSNTIYNVTYGMIVASSNTIISKNNIYNNTNAAVNIPSDYNYVRLNSFINNNIGNTQVLDDGVNNTIVLNYWNEQTSPDTDSNGIVDNPYLINGTAGNADPYPLTFPYDIFSNLAPVVIDFIMTPLLPKTQDDITANFTHYDPEGDPLLSAEIIWYRNGILQGVLNNSFLLLSSDTTKGEEWHYKIRLYDGYNYSNWLGAPFNATIANTAPVASNLAITPNKPSTDDDLTATWTYSDDDGDLEASAIIHWYRNSVYQPVYDNQMTKLSTTTNDWESWYFTIQPFDGIEYGTEQVSSSVIIGQERTPFLIDDNSDFPSMGFTGAGTYVDPYIFDGYTITNSTSALIVIRDTTAYFIIRNAVLDGNFEGIVLENVTHATIDNNIIHNCYIGIILNSSSYNNLIMGNAIYDNYNGVLLAFSANNNTITDNKIYQNSEDGIDVFFSNNNTILNNLIYDNSDYGIRLDDSANNTLFNNTLDNNINYGVNLNSNSQNTSVKWNKFKDNSQSGNTQAIDDGNNNIFAYNYWKEWTPPDTNLDGIVDSPYLIDGTSNNNDSLPLTYPYTHHDPISINIDADFEAYSFPGNGTLGNPYIIDGFYITTSTSHPIEIQNTSSYFIIRNCLLLDINGNFEGLSLQNVTHATTFSNIIGGITLRNSTFNTLLDNIIFNTSWTGINLYASHNNSISSNSISFNAFEGIKLELSANNSFSANNIFNNTVYGIVIQSSEYNRFLNNTIYNHTSYGIYINSSTSDSLVQWNDFYSNSLGASQAFDAGSNNAFNNNYWDDHSGPDANNDDIFDNPYSIDGDNNTDPYPSVVPNKPPIAHELTIPTIVYPNGGETISGIVTIRWRKAYDSFGYSVTYNVSYTTDNITWSSLASGVTSLSLSWDTTLHLNLTTYLIRVIASSVNLTTQDTSDATFTIQNPPIPLPIFIDDNSDFATLSIPGDGSAMDPYVIEGYYFLNSTTNLIEIRDTTVFFIIQNNYLNGMNGNFHGIILENVTHGTIDNNYFYNCRIGIYFNSSSENHLTSNIIYNHQTDGVVLENSNGNLVHHNIIYDNNGKGILLKDSNNITVSYNRIYSNENGIYLQNAMYNKITNNTIYDNGFNGGISPLFSTNGIGSSLNVIISDTGILLDSSNYNFLSKNMVYNNSGNGIYLYASDHTNISSNTIYENGESGIFLENSNHNNLLDNNIYSNGQNGISSPPGWTSGTGSSLHVETSGHGILLDPASYNILSNNEVCNNSGNGIYLYGSENNIVTQNEIYGNGESGVFLENSNNNNITDNIIHDNGQTGTISGGMGSTLEIISSGHGILLDPANYNTIETNVVYGNAGNGIYLFESSDVVVTQNDVYENGECGIFLENSDYNSLIGNEIYNNGQNGASSPLIGARGIGSSIHAITGGHGIFLDPANHNTIGDNTVYGNAGNGIYLFESNDVFITENDIFENEENGVFLEESDDNQITDNDIHHNGANGVNSPLVWTGGIGSSVHVIASGHGILLDPSNNNYVSNNTIYNNSLYGVFISESFGNIIEWNNFLTNNVNNLVSGVTSQAYDDGGGNLFEFNFWDDHNNVDSDGDGLADSGYAIDGSAGNMDGAPNAIYEGATTTQVIEEDPTLIILIIVVILVSGISVITFYLRRRAKIRETYEKERVDRFV